jgi:hypothetical protein
MASGVEEQKNPPEYADCRNKENQNSVLKRRSSLRSRGRGVLVAHGATLRRGIMEGGKETDDQCRHVFRDRPDTIHFHLNIAGGV